MLSLCVQEFKIFAHFSLHEQVNKTGSVLYEPYYTGNISYQRGTLGTDRLKGSSPSPVHILA